MSRDERSAHPEDLLDDWAQLAFLSFSRQITTSPERLLAFIRFRLDCTGARGPLHAFRFVGETGAALAGLTSEELA